MEEIWKDIKGYEGKYQVSNLGRVKSLSYKNSGKVKIMIQVNHKGYLRVGLCKNGRIKKHLVHRLVATAFLENIYKLDEVDHINTNKSDNNVRNLKWCNRIENMNNPLTLKNSSKAFTGNKNPMHGMKGSQCPGSRKIGQYSLDGILIKKWDCIKHASQEMNIYSSGIIRCCQGKTKSAYGYKWVYEET